MNMTNPATLYNVIRHHVFSTYNKDGIEKGYECLYAKKPQMPAAAWIGLKAELDFYSRYKDEFTLDVSCDCGNKCDFVGNIEGINNCRIDVTTNIDYKDLSEYEPIQKEEGRKYKIVIMDKSNGEIKEIVDLNFPFSCNGGRLFDIAIFMPQDYNSKGEARYNYWQRILTVDSCNPSAFNEEVEIITDWYLPDIHTQIAEIYDADVPNPEDKVNQFLVDSAKFLSKITNRNIVACGQIVKEYNSFTDDEDVFTKLYWRHPVIENYLDQTIYLES